MNEQIIHINPNYLVDTGVFIAWARGETAAREFFHHPPGRIYFIPLISFDTTPCPHPP